MGDHFKPWRRKFGIMTLVMACVFAAMWVRGIRQAGYIDYQRFTMTYCGFLLRSDSNALTVIRVLNRNGLVVPEEWARLPHRITVVPLTLLSAFLLLTKPRKSTQKKIAEPVQIEGL